MDDTVVRLTGNERTAGEWALVLTAAGIRTAVRSHGPNWAVCVAAEDAATAIAALDAYDRERLEPQTPETPGIEYGRTWTGYWLAAALVAFYGALAGYGTLAGSTEPGRWYDQGTAYARRILAGELWRAVTALTLHASVAHVAANAVACTLFVTAVCRAVGPGIGLWLVLLAGTGGNLLNAVLRGAPHGAIGASTAIFGAVGVLGALQFMKRYRFGRPGTRAWIPIAAALGLLAMLGTGQESDVLAHLFGFLAGGLLGVIVSLALPVPPPAAVQRLLVIAAIAAVVAAWRIALG